MTIVVIVLLRPFFYFILSLVPNRNKARENVRQEKLAVYRETKVWPSSKGDKGPTKKTEAWSEKKAQLTRKKERKKLRVEQKAKRKRAAVDEDEWNELAKDARLLKKLKKRKVRTAPSSSLRSRGTSSPEIRLSLCCALTSIAYSNLRPTQYLSTKRSFRKERERELDKVALKLRECAH